MSRTRIPCLSPQICGVKFHYAGTQSRCQGNLTGSSGTASSLSMAGPRLAQFDEGGITERVERIPRVVHSTKNNKLQSLVERFGSKYDGAHRAQRDAGMTRDALNAFHDEMSKTPGEPL